MNRHWQTKIREKRRGKRGGLKGAVESYETSGGESYKKNRYELELQCRRGQEIERQPGAWVRQLPSRWCKWLSCFQSACSMVIKWDPPRLKELLESRNSWSRLVSKGALSFRSLCVCECVKGRKRDASAQLPFVLSLTATDVHYSTGAGHEISLNKISQPHDLDSKQRSGVDGEVQLWQPWGLSNQLICCPVIYNVESCLLLPVWHSSMMSFFSLGATLKIWLLDKALEQHSDSLMFCPSDAFIVPFTRLGQETWVRSWVFAQFKTCSFKMNTVSSTKKQ